MSKIFFLSVMLLVSLLTFSQNLIYFRDIDQFVDCSKLDSTYIVSSSKRQFRIVVADYLGKAQVREYDKKNRLMKEYNYENAIDTFKRYVVQVNPITLEEKIIVQKYFEPILSGNLYVYDKKGRLKYTLKCKFGTCQ